MPVIAVGTFDTIEGSIVTILTAFSVQQAAMDATKAFTVSRRRFRDLTAAEFGPSGHVAVTMDSLAPGSEGSAHIYEAETATYLIDCYSKGVEVSGTPSDEDAMKRLYYLAQQVKHALFRLVNSDFGQAVGVIARRQWPRFSLLVPTDKEIEEQIVAGRWTLEVDYSWTPEDTGSGQALTEIRATEFLKQYAPQGGVTKTFP